MTAVLRWFEGGGEGDLPALARQLAIAKPAQLTWARLAPGQSPATAGEPTVCETVPWFDQNAEAAAAPQAAR